MRHPFSKVACLLLLLQLASAKEAYEVEFAGKLYGVLDRTDPRAGYNSNSNCQVGYLPLPAGAIVAPDTAAIRKNVCGKHVWSTHCLVLASGRSCDVRSGGGECGGSLLTQGNTYAVDGCSRRVLYERDAATTTATTTTATVTTATATTTTTYSPNKCHGISEPAACGTRIPTGDCFAGGEHQKFAEESCPAMCGLACSSTTTTKTSTTTTTTTTKTTTTSTSTTTTTTKTTVTTFTTTTVLTLNANCNPRDDRCDAQEGLSCDVEHNKCRHSEDVTVPPFLQAEVDRLIKDAVDSAKAEKDRDIAALTSSKDADIAAMAASIHEKEIVIVTAKANLTICSSKLEARRLVRLANAAEDLAALNNGEPADPCAGQADPAECDLWSTDQCGTVLFGNVNVTEACPALCDNCIPPDPHSSNDPNASGTDDGTGNSTLFVAVGICAGIVILATVINIMIRQNAAKEEDNKYGNAGAFVNPMYSESQPEKGSNQDSSADPHVYGGNSAFQEESYQEIPVPTTSNSTYDAAGAAEVDTYEDIAGGGAEDTYEDIAGGGAEDTYENVEEDYLNVGNSDLNC